jgi:hypothetical protein
LSSSARVSYATLTCLKDASASPCESDVTKSECCYERKGSDASIAAGTDGQVCLKASLICLTAVSASTCMRQSIEYV